MKKKSFWSVMLAASLAWMSCPSFVSAAETFDPVEYVSPLVGTQSTFELSTGNTYPAIARPWGMNFWTPQTGKMVGNMFIQRTRFAVSNRHISRVLGSMTTGSLSSCRL